MRSVICQTRGTSSQTSISQFRETPIRLWTGRSTSSCFTPELGGIILEVKGGSRVGVEDGDWWSENREGRHPIKNPYQQASGYKYTLKQLIQERCGVSVWFGHAVAFPSTSSVDGSIGMTGPEQLTIMKNDLDAITPALERIVGFLSPPRQRLSGAELDKVVRALAPTAVIAVDLSDGSDDIRRAQIELTQQQHAVLASVAHWPRAWVKGAAGTGKTVLAVSRARTASQSPASAPCSSASTKRSVITSQPRSQTVPSTPGTSTGWPRSSAGHGLQA